MSKNTIWSESEDSLLVKLRSKNIPFKELVNYFPGRSQDGLRNRIYTITKLNNNLWVRDERVAILDTECSDLNAYSGFLLTWALAYVDTEKTVTSDCIKKKDINKGNFDKVLLQSLLDELKNVDILVTYYGKRYDVPFLRSRALFHNLDFPTVGTIKHIDLYDSVKHKLKLPRNTLDMATNFLGIEGKNHVDLGIWLKAKYGDKESLDYILDHNKRDVEITRSLYEKLLPVVKFTKGAL